MNHASSLSHFGLSRLGSRVRESWSRRRGKTRLRATHSEGAMPRARSPDVKLASIFDLATSLPLPHQKFGSMELEKMFEIALIEASCIQPELLEAKYGAPGVQSVVSITNKATLEQTWFNEVRTRKPQTFSAAEGNSVQDPTEGGKRCDFCKWESLTAADTFGRVEMDTCVTASNLFKYCAPYHGLVLFKEHHPLVFDQKVIADMMACASEWFSRAAAQDGDIGRQLYPFLLWNCLARAGASQFHGHAQVMLSSKPFPQVARMESVVKNWPGYYQDVLAAHRAAGLHFESGDGGEYAQGYVNLTSVKDMDIVIQASSIQSPGLHRLLHAALRTLIDDFGAVSFNVGVLNIEVNDAKANGEMEWSRQPPVQARIVSRGSMSSKASDFGGLEVFSGASIGHTDPYIIIEKLRVRLDALGM